MVPKIAILGFRGVGKSSVSCQLQKLTGYPLYALDRIIESVNGYSITEIVKRNGWNYFRDLELDALKEYSGKETAIIDCGGGILEGHEGGFSRDKFDILKKNFYCVYIYLDDDSLLERLGKIRNNSSRPALQSDLKETLNKRKPWFEEIADLSLDTARKAPDEIARLIYERMKLVHA